MSRWRARLLRIRPGLKSFLLCLLLPGIVLSLAYDSWNDYQTLSHVTTEAYDHMLQSQARMLESSITFGEDGRARVDAPWYTWASLESSGSDRIYYRVAEHPPGEAPGLISGPEPPVLTTLLGMRDLPLPPVWPSAWGTPVFYDAIHRGEPVRVVAIARAIYHEGSTHYLLVQVAQSAAFLANSYGAAWKQESSRDIRTSVVVVILVWLGVSWALLPLSRLRDDIHAREPDDFTPLDTAGVPRELEPLVAAVNHHIDRHRSIVEEQTQFLADASHQLRTPLAVMLMQSEYALREADPQRVREGLSALVLRLGQTRRLTEQLLSLAHARHSPGDGDDQRFDLAAVAREVLVQYLPLARAKAQDLGWGNEDDDAATCVAMAGGNPDGIREALANLVHNAIRHTPRGGRVTVSAGAEGEWAWASVSDTGPGVPEAQRDQVFERFRRDVQEPPPGERSGAGLGLSISRAYARRAGGDITLADGEPNEADGYGLLAVLRLPARG